MSRYRTALLFLARSLDLRAAGFALALLSVTVGASVTATALALRADLGPKMTRELRAFGPNLLVGPPPAGRSLEQGWVDRLAALAGGPAAVSPFLIAGGAVDGVPAVLVGVSFARARAVAPPWRLEGAWPGGDGACLVGARIAAEAGLSPGARAAVAAAGGGAATLEVSGIVHTGEAEDDQVMVPLAWLQGAVGMAGRISGAAVALESGPREVEALAARLRGAGVEARPLRQVSEAQGALLGRLDRMMMAMAAAVLLLAGMCVMTTLMSIVVERGPEIGLMRSLGASDGEVMRMLLGEATLLGACGGLLGLALGAWDARWIGRQVFGAEVQLRAGVVPLVFLVTLGLCWLAVLLPLRRAMAVQPASALRGE